MVTVTQNAVELQSSATQTAGGGDTTGSEAVIDTSFGGTATLTVTNGATAPTVACIARLEYREDSTGTWRELFRRTAGLANSGVYSWPVPVPAGIYGIRTVFGSNTVQNVTIEAQFHKVTSIG